MTVRNFISYGIKCFFNNFTDEQNCREFFNQQREAKGIACSRCGFSLLLD